MARDLLINILINYSQICLLNGPFGKNDKDRLIKVIEDGTVKELSEYITNLIPQFLEHCYIKRNQSASYQKERVDAETNSEHYNPSHALIQVDFSENYTCISQDEIQSAHWKQSQVSLFTVAVWHSGSLKSYVFASDNLSHSKDTVVAYVDFVLDQLPDIVKTVSIWSDGPCSQFKNRYIFASIPYLETRHSVGISWNFFATSHGKGPVDGIGGSVKRYVWGKVKSRVHMVCDSKSFTKASEGMQHVTTVNITKEEIEEKNSSLKVKDIFQGAPAIPRIAKCHHFYIKNGKPIVQLLSK